jgi:two-component system CitB family sensor kinase
LNRLLLVVLDLAAIRCKDRVTGVTIDGHFGEVGAMSTGRRLSTQILLSQLAVLGVVSVAGLGLFVHEARHSEDQQYEQRALAVALATASLPEVVQGLSAGDTSGDLQSIAERVRRKTGAAYVVIIDRQGIRHSHPSPDLIGKRIAEPVVALDGRTHMGVDNGRLGRSANGKAPVMNASGQVVGEVSAGILESQVAADKSRELRRLALVAAAALIAGVLVSLWLARRLKRQTFGLELHAIADLLQEREAMLHGIREGVVTFDPDGRVSLVNDEARRLLGFGEQGVGKRLDELVPAGRLQDLLSGDVRPGDDEVVLTDRFCLKVNRMPVRMQGRDLGAVVTVRDRTEHVELLRELDSVASLTEALRGQQHEHANRMHTVAGLLELDRPEDAASYLTEVAGDAAGLAERLRDSVGNPTIVALLLGKATVARERGVALTVNCNAPIGNDVVQSRLAVTVLGNLLDNAVDAVAGRPDAAVQVELSRRDDTFLIRVVDNGPGVDPAARGRLFDDGFSTKPARGSGHRGLGLALVHRLVTQAGGTIALQDAAPTTFDVRLPVRTAASR